MSKKIDQEEMSFVVEFNETKTIIVLTIAGETEITRDEYIDCLYSFIEDLEKHPSLLDYDGQLETVSLDH